MYADYEYYVANYRMNTPEIVSGLVFAYWEKQAEKELDKRTLGRLRRSPELVTDEVRDCVCEISELLYKADSAWEQATAQGGVGLLTSYSNDGESGTFDVSQSIYSEEGKTKKIRDIIYKHLAYTGLLYSGV